MQKIAPFLWFADQAEEAAKFYTSVFESSKIIEVNRYGEVGPGKAGDVMTVVFELEGQQFIALNGGPQHFNFSQAISFQVQCQSQEEVDYLWGKLTDGGEESMCGWLKDKYGLSWQITPTALLDMLRDPDPERSQRAMQAMLKMSKIDIAAIAKAAAGK